MNLYVVKCTKCAIIWEKKTRMEPDPKTFSTQHWVKSA